MLGRFFAIYMPILHIFSTWKTQDGRNFSSFLKFWSILLGVSGLDTNRVRMPSRICLGVSGQNKSLFDDVFDFFH